MDRINTINAREDMFGVGKSGFHDNADLPGQDATYVSPDWLNHLQEELCNLLELNGVALNADSKQQLFNLLTTQTELVALSDAIESNFIRKAQKGVAEGVTPLNAQSIVDSSFLPNSSLIKAGIVQLVNDLTSGGTDKALTAEQGKILQNNKLDITDFKSQLNAFGSAPVYACRTWLYASLVGGTPIALGSGNISSLTDLAVGKFSANFTISMPDENYAALLASNKADYSNSFAYESAQRTISQVTIQNKQDDASSSDGYFSVVIFR